MSFATLIANLNLNISNFSSQLQAAQSQVTRFSQNLNARLNTGFTEPIKKAKFEFKDVARIVQGILISKVFYSGMNAIRNATSSVIDFHHALDQAQVSYSALFKDVALAKEFINVLQDFAAKTPVSFKEAEETARRLAAFSIPAENLMYMMQGITAAASATKSPMAMERISRALGQMYTKGRVVQQELNQLTEAGIPAFEILREKLGLTQEELGNIAKAGIPASEAINALIDGMNERYGQAMEATAKTLPGIIAQIQDNLLQIAQTATEGLYGSVRTALGGVLETLVGFRKALQTHGLGGLFEAIFPPHLHGTIREIVGGLGTLLAMIVQLWKALEPLRKALNDAFLQTLAMIIPVVNTAIAVLVAIVRIFFQNASALQVLSGVLMGAAVAWLVFKAAALGATILQGLIGIITGVAKAVLFLGTVLITNPLVGLLMILAGALVGIAVASSKAGEGIRSFFSNITKMQGMDTSKLILPSQKERTAELGKFNNRLTGTNDALDDLAKNSKKAMKGLMSFDEVYRIMEPEGAGVEDSLDDLLSAFDDMAFPEIELPDFGGFATDFVNGFIEAIKERFMRAGLGAIIGGILGAILGGLIGNPILGAKIGAVAGALVGWFWDEIMKAFGMTDSEGIATLILMSLAAILGAVLAGLPGAIIGGALALLASTFGKMLWQKLAEYFGLGEDDAMRAHISSLIGSLLGALIGGLLFGPIGALLGSVIGYFAAGFVGLFWEKLKEAFGFNDGEGLGLIIGGSLGAIIGGLIGGPGGALIGAGIGALIGWFAGHLISSFENADEITAAWDEVKRLIAHGFATGEWDFEAIWASIKLFAQEIGNGFKLMFSDPANIPYNEIGIIVGTLVGAAIGLGLGGVPGLLLGGILGAWVGETIGVIVDGFMTGDWEGKFAQIGPVIGMALGGAIGFVFGGPAGAAIGLAIGALVGTLFGNLIDAINGGSEQAKAQLGGSLGAIIGGGIGFLLGGPIGAIIGVLVGGLLGALIGGWDEMLGYFGGYATENFIKKLKEIWGWVGGFFDTEGKQWWEIGRDIVLGILAGIGAVIATIGIALWDYLVAPIIDGIKYLFGIQSPATTMFVVGEMIVKGIFQGISDFIGWLIDGIGGFVTEIVDAVTGWTSETASSIGEWVSGTVKSIGDWSKEAGAKISTWTTEKAKAISEWATTTAKDVKTWATDTGKDISTWTSDTAKGIKTWVKERGSEFATWTSDTAKDIGTWVKDTTQDVSTWASDTGKSIGTWASDKLKDIKTWATDTKKEIGSWTSDTAKDVVKWSTDVGKNITDWTTNTKRDIQTWIGDTALSVSTWVSNRVTDFNSFKDDTMRSITNWASDGLREFTSFINTSEWDLSSWASRTLSTVSGWANDIKNAISGAFDKAKDAVSGLWDKLTGASNVSVNVSGLSGHATGGVFNREHVAKFAEGNKAEAIIPLEEASAMQPFVDAVANGLSRLMPQPALAGGAAEPDTRPILYVGTLIADDRSLTELERRMKVVRLKEGRRTGADLSEDKWNSN